MRPYWRVILWCSLLGMLAGCGSMPNVKSGLTATPTSPCASVLPGAGIADLSGTGFPLPLVFPTGSLITSPTQIVSGPGLFSISTFTVCSPNTSASGVLDFFEEHLPAIDHGWIAAAYFPDDGALMQPCVTRRCWYDALSFDRPLESPPWYLVFDNFVDRGSNRVTYRARYAQVPQFPSCKNQYMDSPTPNFYYYLPDLTLTPQLPLPPLTFLAPDNVPGQRGYHLCSPGTAASVTAILTTELPATGWTHVSSDPRCVWSDQCWTNNGSAVSWHVVTADAWQIAWRL